MTRPDDCFVAPSEFRAIQKQAKKALEAADAIGRFPTPIDDVMEAARVIVADEAVLDDSFLRRVRRKARSALRRALSKVIGLLDAVARIVYIDQTILVVKQTFLKLHEVAHAVLPWQRDIYCAIEDCEKTLDPDISEAFDREASVFASEVLFQLDGFTKQVADLPFEIGVPLKYSRKYGASVYATIRRYVSTHHSSCAVLVIDPPIPKEGNGFIAPLRRVVPSESFVMSFGKALQWPDQFTPDDQIGAMLPIGRKMSRPRGISLRDCNGNLHECVAEAFATKYHVFVLVHSVKTLNRMIVIMPGSRGSFA